MAAAMSRSVDDRSQQKTNLQSTLESAAPFVLALLVGLGAADLSIVGFRDSLLATQPPPTRGAKRDMIQPTNKAAYQPIISRNIFSPDGLIPDPISSKGDANHPGRELPPVPSQLPLNVLGTIVLTDSDKSVATIEVKSKNQVIAVGIGRDIDTVANLVKVERNKIIIRNLNNGRLEYIEAKTNNKLAFSGGVAAVAPRVPGEIKQVAPNKYKLSRTTITKHTQDLSKLLMQASTVPRKKANGDIECYVLTSFQPDSIYADIGVMQGDCIKSVNGEPIDSPAKAMELYGALKNANTIKIVVETDGHDVEKEYTIE